MDCAGEIMVRLSRTVRFCVNPPEAGVDDLRSERSNTFAAWPTWRGLGRYFELTVECVGEVDAVTGYFFNIREVDEAVRTHAIERISRACRETPTMHPSAVLREVYCAIDSALRGDVDRIEWSLTPFLKVIGQGANMSECLISQQFDFAASHRLHCDTLSDAENEQLFGKCNRSTGHGHNYRVEVTVAVGSTSDERPIDIGRLEAVVNETVIERFDHRHLNVDCPEFADRNPSVENITRTCFDLLEPRLGEAGIRLRRVRVWETDKTSATYPA